MRMMVPSKDPALRNSPLPRCHFAQTIATRRSRMICENYTIETLQVLRRNGREQDRYKSSNVTWRNEVVVELTNFGWFVSFRVGH
jgi:hypothetical protein